MSNSIITSLFWVKKNWARSIPLDYETINNIQENKQIKKISKISKKLKEEGKLTGNETIKQSTKIIEENMDIDNEENEEDIQMPIFCEDLKNEINNINEEDNKDNIKDYKFKSDGDWEIIRKKNKDDKDEYDEDEVIDESIKEVKGMTNSMKNFNQNVKDSNKLIGVTNKHFDKSHKHVNKAIKKMEDIC